MDRIGDDCQWSPKRLRHSHGRAPRPTHAVLASPSYVGRDFAQPFHEEHGTCCKNSQHKYL